MSRRLPTLPAFAALCFAATFLMPPAPAAAPAPVSVFPIRTADASLPLNGTWDFRYVAGLMDAAKRPSDFGLDSKITVPGHWELQGFCDPVYKRPAEGAGYYRRTFRVPKNWRAAPNAQRIFLRFEGVLYGFDVWINGKPAGSWASAYNPVTFDITDHLHPAADADNIIEVRVTTRNKGWEFDTNDCWGISGIYRDVFIFAAPAGHFENFSTRTTLNPDGSADLYVAIQAIGEPPVRVRLLAPDGKLVSEVTTTTATQFHVTTPLLWTAETPSLYTIELSIPGQTITEKIGLRQITIDGPVLKLNGAPIKLRGVNHHDIWPDTGRTATVELIRRDLELMRAANINFIRTSHYPPDHRLLDLADEMGFYVMCEVPFGFGDKHLTDPSYQDILLTRARATIARDQNRPSIIVWSVGNENPITDIQLETGREVKRLDPTRPICFPTVGSYFARNYEKFPDFVDIYALHYPNVKILTRHAQTLDRPVIVTEYAHALGLATERIHALWEIMRTSPNMAGGAIWMFQDQGITRTGDINDPELAKQPYVWPDKTHYYDTGKIDGMDGLVYSDRRPQTDYYETRKVYSPVYIPETTLDIGKDTDAFLIHIENRHDFRPLSGFQLKWSFEINGTRTQPKTISLQTAAGKTAPVRIPFPSSEFSAATHDQSILHIQCLNESGVSIYERGIKITGQYNPWDLKTNGLHRDGKPATLEETADTIRIKHANYIITTNRATAETTIAAPDGRPLVTGIYPHTGRRFTEAEKLRITRHNTKIWPEPCLTKINTAQVNALKTGDTIILDVRTNHSATHGSFQGGYTLLVFPNGNIEVGYSYTIRGEGVLLEAGLTLIAPSDATRYRWLGHGPLPNTPYKSTAGEFGRHHLARGDLSFSGNRRDTELALLSRPDGSGILVATGGDFVAVESNPGSTTLSHNALVSGRGNKGSAPELEISVETFGYISGGFTLIPLSSDWPDLLVRWLGNPTERVTPETPYLRSYDQ